MFNIEVGSMRAKAKAYSGVQIRCDRMSPLGNPFGIAVGRAKCIEKYEANWDYMMQNSEAKKHFEFIKEQHKCSNIVLLCWCKPLACHCDIIKSKVLEAE